MSSIFQIRQINREEINFLIQNLNDFEKDTALKGGLKAAGNTFMQGGKSRLKRRMKSGSTGITGNLLRSFQVRVKRNKPGVLIGFKQGNEGGSHASLIDRGTKDRYWKTKKRKYVGRVLPSLFWTDTETMDYPKAMDKLYLGIEKAVSRISSRT